MKTPSRRVENVVVTGASRGLGRALAERFAEGGAGVALVARDEAALVEVAESIKRRGGRAVPVAVDIADLEAPARIHGEATYQLGEIDALIHNASNLGPVPLVPLSETSDIAFEDAVRVNLLAPFRLTRTFTGAMVGRGRGLVVFVSSDAAVEAYPDWGAYGATKAAADHLSRIWAAELEGSGVGVVAIDPGEMRTKMHADALPDADPDALQDPAEAAERIVRFLYSREEVNGRFSAAQLGALS